MIDAPMHPQEIEEHMRAVRKRSGEVSTNLRLVSFLYELMRDHLPPGTVETVAMNSQAVPINLTNGWLANYAKDVAKRLGPVTKRKKPKR